MNQLMSTRATRLAVGASIFTAASALLFACAESGDERPPDRSDSGTTVLPEVDGSTAPDGADGSAEAGSVDAGLGPCSAGGFCHTVLPPGQNLRGVWGDGQGIVWSWRSTRPGSLVLFGSATNARRRSETTPSFSTRSA